MQCLNERTIKLYVRGGLAAADMLAASEHVRACAECRARLLAMAEYSRAAWSVEETVLAVAECPEYEVLSAFVDEKLAHESHEAVERHVSLCELCWRDVETLQAARSRTSLAPPVVVRPGQYAPERPRIFLGWRRVAAGVIAAAAAVALILVTQSGPVSKPPKSLVARGEQRAPGGERRAVSSEGLEAPATPRTRYPIPDTQRPTPNTQHPTPEPGPAPAVPTPRPEFVVVLDDGNVAVGRADGKLTVRSDGRDLDPELQALVEEKLRDGRVQSSFTMAANPEGAPLRDDPPDVMEIGKLSPAPGGLLDAAQEFRWEPVDGAVTYRVEVFDLEGTFIISEVVEETSYTPAKRLPAGGYLWMVWVQRSRLGEWEPSRAAQFRVLSDRETGLVSRARRDYPGSHLVLGTVYESLGLRQEAVEEFKMLAADNPGSALAARLLAGAQRAPRE